MRSLVRLLAAEAKNWGAQILHASEKEKFRGLLFLLLVAAFAVSAEYLSFRLFRAFASAGDIYFEFIALVLTLRTLALFFLIIFVLLFFGALIASIDALFFDRDIDFLSALPISRTAILMKKFIQVYVTSSWIVFLVVPPVMVGYGRAFSHSALHLPLSLAALLFFSLIATFLAAGIVVALVRFLPIDKAKESILAISVLLSFGVIYFYRLLSPAKLFAPHASQRLISDAAAYLRELTMPLSEHLPSSAMASALVAAAPLTMAKMPQYFEHLSFLMLAALASFAFYLLSGFTMFATDRPVSGSAARPGPIESVFRLGRLAEFLSNFAPAGRRRLYHKEIIENVRNPMQLSHLFLMLGIVALHLANLSELPFRIHPGARTLIAFLNLGLVGFMISAVAVRFVYPSPSLEGNSFWLIESAPISPSDFIIAKFLVVFIPIAAASLLLVIGSNLFIDVPAQLTFVWSLAALSFSASICAMGIAAGFAMPHFKSSNVFEISSSQGGIIFLVLSLLYVLASIVVLVPPTYASAFGRGSFFAGRGLAVTVGIAASSAAIVYSCYRISLSEFEGFIEKRNGIG